MVVFKYQLKETAQEQRVVMPFGARILHVAAQGEIVCVWALVDPAPNAFVEQRRLIVCATGEGTDPKWDYLGTALVNGGEYVWHVFEIKS